MSADRGGMVDQIIAWESGEMTDENEVIEFFQELVDSGMAWRLQGSYGRAAKRMIDMGLISMPKGNR